MGAFYSSELMEWGVGASLNATAQLQEDCKMLTVQQKKQMFPGLDHMFFWFQTNKPSALEPEKLFPCQLSFTSCVTTGICFPHHEIPKLNIGIRPARWLGGERHLMPSLMTWAQWSGPHGARRDSTPESFPLTNMCVHVYVFVQTHVHTHN